MKILLGLTGSVATTLHLKLIEEFKKRNHEVAVIYTDKATQFMDSLEIFGVNCYGDEDEYYKPGEYYSKGSIYHIVLRDWADVMVIAPCTANTMAKISNGICDNLLTSIVRAWDSSKPLYIAPAMNTNMWTHKSTTKHIDSINELGFKLIWPTSNILACGQSGIGAMAHIHTIANIVEGHKWATPLLNSTTCPVYPAQGSFGHTRKHYNHTGVDLYAQFIDTVIAVEDGEIIAIEPFTGEIAGTPWWNDTYSVSVKGKSGIIVYGEISPVKALNVGDIIKTSYPIGHILRVLKNEPSPTNKPFGHTPTMLHIELLHPDSPRAVAGDWNLFERKNKYLLDPTPYLALIAAKTVNS